MITADSLSPEVGSIYPRNIVTDYVNNFIDDPANIKLGKQLFTLNNLVFRQLLNALISGQCSISEIKMLEHVTDDIIMERLKELEDSFSYLEMEHIYPETELVEYDMLNYVMVYLNLKELLATHNVYKDEHSFYRNYDLKRLRNNIKFNVLTERTRPYLSRVHLKNDVSSKVLDLINSEFGSIDQEFPIEDQAISDLFEGDSQTKEILSKIYKDVFLGHYLVESLHIDDRAEALIDMFICTQVQESLVVYEKEFIQRLINHIPVGYNFKYIVKKMLVSLAERNKDEPEDERILKFEEQEFIDKISDFLNGLDFKTSFSNKMSYLHTLEFTREYIRLKRLEEEAKIEKQTEGEIVIEIPPYCVTYASDGQQLSVNDVTVFGTIVRLQSFEEDEEDQWLEYIGEEENVGVTPSIPGVLINSFITIDPRYIEPELNEDGELPPPPIGVDKYRWRDASYRGIPVRYTSEYICFTQEGILDFLPEGYEPPDPDIESVPLVCKPKDIVAKISWELEEQARLRANLADPLYDEYGNFIEVDKDGRPIEYDIYGRPIEYDDSGNKIILPPPVFPTTDLLEGLFKLDQKMKRLCDFILFTNEQIKTQLNLEEG